jgi:hypothetical protein
MATRKSNSFFANATRVFASIANVNLFAPASEMFKYGYALVARTFSITAMVVLLFCSCAAEELGGTQDKNQVASYSGTTEKPTVEVTVDTVRQEADVVFTYNGKTQSFTVKAQLTPEKEHIIEAENLPISSFKASEIDTIDSKSYSEKFTYPYGNGNFKNTLKTSADKLSVELAAGVTVGVKFGSMSHNTVKSDDNQKLSKPRSDEYEASYLTNYSGEASWSTFGAKENKSFGIPVIADNYRNIAAGRGEGESDLTGKVERKLDPERDRENIKVYLVDKDGNAKSDTVKTTLAYGATAEKPNLGSYDVTGWDDYKLYTAANGEWGAWTSSSDSDSRIKRFRQEKSLNGVMWDKDEDNSRINTLYKMFREKLEVTIDTVTVKVSETEFTFTDNGGYPKASETSDKDGFKMANLTDASVAKYGDSNIGYDDFNLSEKAKLYVKAGEAKQTGMQYTGSFEHQKNLLSLTLTGKPLFDDGTKGRTIDFSTTAPEDWYCISSWTTKAKSVETVANNTGEIKRIESDKFIKDSTIVVNEGTWTLSKYEVRAEQTVTVEVGNVQTNKWIGHYWKVKSFKYKDYEYKGDDFDIKEPSLSNGAANVTVKSQGTTATDYNYSVEGRLVFSDITRRADATGVITVENGEKTLVDYKTEINTRYGVLYSFIDLTCTKTWSDGSMTKTSANFVYNSIEAKLEMVESTENAVGENLSEIKEEITKSIAQKSEYFKFNEQFVDVLVPVWRQNKGNSAYKLSYSRANDVVYVDPEVPSLEITIANPNRSKSYNTSDFVLVNSEVKANNDTLQTWNRDVTFVLTAADDTQSFSTKGIEYINRSYVAPEKKLTNVVAEEITNTSNALYHGTGAKLYKVYDDGSKELFDTLSKGFDGSSRAVGYTTTEPNVAETLGSVSSSLISSTPKSEGNYTWNENTYKFTVSGSRPDHTGDYEWYITICEDIKYTATVEGYAVNISWDNFSKSASSSANDFSMTSETPVSGGKNQIWSRAHNLLYTINGQTVNISNSGVINTFVKDEEPPVTPDYNASITSIINTVCFTPARDGETGHTILLKLDNGNVIPVGSYGNTVVWGNEVADHNYNGAGFIANASKVMAGELVPCVIEYENGNEVILYKTWYEGQWAPIDRFELIKAQGAGWNNSGNVWEDKTDSFRYSTEQLNGAVKVTIGNESHTFKGISSARTRGGSRRW